MERVTRGGDAAYIHPVGRLGCFLLSLVLLGFYSFIILMGSDEENPYEVGLRAVCYGPSCLLMGIGYMLMAFISRRAVKVLLYLLPVIISGLNIFLFSRIYHPAIEKVFFQAESHIGMFLLKLVHWFGSAGFS